MRNKNIGYVDVETQNTGIYFQRTFRMFLAQALSLSLLFVWFGQFSAGSYKPPKPDFYTQKLKSYFAHTDANGDGVLSRTDYDTMAHIFIYTVHLCRYDAKILLKKKVPGVNLINMNLNNYLFSTIV